MLIIILSLLFAYGPRYFLLPKRLIEIRGSRDVMTEHCLCIRTRQSNGRVWNLKRFGFWIYQNIRGISRDRATNTFIHTRTLIHTHTSFCSLTHKEAHSSFYSHTHTPILLTHSSTWAQRNRWIQLSVPVAADKKRSRIFFLLSANFARSKLRFHLLAWNHRTMT